jgi:acyl carrier protein
MSHYKDDYLKNTKVILAVQLGLDESDITAEKNLYDLGADSLDDVELIMAFEEEYDIEISDEDAEKCRTVAAIVEYLERRLGPSNAKGDSPPSGD